MSTKNTILLAIGLTLLTLAGVAVHLLCFTPQRYAIVNNVTWKAQDDGLDDQGVIALDLSGWGHSPGTLWVFGNKVMHRNPHESLPSAPGPFQVNLDIATEGDHWRDHCRFEKGQTLQIPEGGRYLLYSGTFDGQTYEVYLEGFE